MPKFRRVWIIVAIVVVILIIGFFVAQHFLNADNYRGRIEAALSDSLGRQVHLGHLDFSLFSGSLVATAPSISDDPSFSNQPFITAKSINIGVEVGKLLFSRELHITGFTINKPTIHLIRKDDGTWNYGSLGGQGKAKQAQSGNPIPNLTVNRIQVKDGTVTVASLPAHGQPHVYSAVNVSADNFSFVKSFPFQISCDLPAGGSLNIKGDAGPLNQRDASLTPFSAAIKVNDADLMATGFIQPSQGVSGLASLDARIVSDGKVASISGKVRLTQLKLAQKGTPSAEPVDVQFAIEQNLQALSGKIDKGDVQVGTAPMAVTGTYQTRGDQTTTQLTAVGQNMPIDSLVAFLPSLGIQLPSGSRLQGGTLTANLTITGPTSAPVVSGPVRISNTRLAGFDLGKKLSAIRMLTGAKTGQDTTIQTLDTDLHYGPDGTRTDSLVAVVTGLGSASGSGSISPDDALNYHLRIKLASGGAGGAVTKAAGLLPGVFGSAVTQTTKNGIPVAITGTTSNPVFAPEIGGMIPGATQNKQKTTSPLGKALGGLLHH